MVDQYLWSVAIALTKLEHHKINHVRCELLQTLRCRDLQHRTAIDRHTISGIACFRVPDKPEMQWCSVGNTDVVDAIHITSFFRRIHTDIIKAIEDKFQEFPTKEAELEICVRTDEVFEMHIEIGSEASTACK